jgi:hypothetical protein
MDLRGVLYQEGGRWLAHVLELDLVAVGDTQEGAVSRLLETLRFWSEDAVETDSVGQLMRPAPAQYWNAFLQAVQHGAHIETTHPEGLRMFDRLQLASLAAAPSAA